MPVLIRPSKLSRENKKRYPNSNNAVIIIVYSESHFDAFYNKHCGRADTVSPEYTLLVINGVMCPRKKDIKRDFEKIITRPDFQINEGTIFVRLPEQYKARIYSGTEDIFLDKTAGKGNFRIRDCKKIVSPADYRRLIKTGEITKEDIITINAIKEDANREDITIKFVLFIGHIDIVKI